MEVPNAVKMFAWRACQNILPTRRNLCKRRVIEEANCPCCGLEEESLIHALWTCPAAPDVWGSKTSPFQKCCVSGVTFKEIFEDGLQRFSKENLELLIGVARGIWFRRNKFVFEGTFTHPDEVYTVAVRFIREYKESKQLDQSVLMQPVKGSSNSSDTITWSPPSNGFIKLNWDAAINKIKGWIWAS